MTGRGAGLDRAGPTGAVKVDQLYPTELEALARALAEVAELSRAGLTGAALWEPVLAVPGDEVGAGLAAWVEQVAGTEVEPYAKATCGIERLVGTVGASAGDLLDGLVATIQGHLDTTEALAGAMAGPRASARLLQYLPLAGLALGLVMGTNVVAVLCDGGIGTCALVLGLGLMLLGRTWSGVLLRRARGSVDVAGLVAVDILAATLRAGLPIPAALQATAGAWPGPCGDVLSRAGRSLAAGQTWEQAWQPAPQGLALAGIERALGLGWRSGVRCGPLLKAVKASVLRAERLRGLKASGRLGVSLMAPLGLCYLPAFMALGLAPLVISLASGLSLSL